MAPGACDGLTAPDLGVGPLNVIRAVREYERAGVAAIQLEDQALPNLADRFSPKETHS